MWVGYEKGSDGALEGNPGGTRAVLLLNGSHHGCKQLLEFEFFKKVFAHFNNPSIPFIPTLLCFFIKFFSTCHK